MNNGLKLVKENQFYIDMLVSKKLRMGETKKNYCCSRVYV